MKYKIEYFDNQKLIKEEVIDCLNPGSVAQYLGQLWCNEGNYRGFSYKQINYEERDQI
jgi:hypothetical protein